ncbi:MAG: tetratricopeptide repeat protein, partial [Bacteroidota bacterium]
MLKIQPEHILAWYNRAGLKAETQDYSGALEDYDQCIKLFPDFADAYRNRAFVKEKLNRHKDAASDRKMAKSVSTINALKSESLKYRQGMELKRLTSLSADFDKENTGTGPDVRAEDLFLILPEDAGHATYQYYDIYENPAYADTLFSHKTINLSNDFNALKDTTIAKLVDSLDTAIEQSPEKLINYLYRAGLLSLQENFNKAMNDYDKAFELAPENPLVYFSRANTYVLLGLFMEDIDPEQNVYALKADPKIKEKTKINPNYKDALADYNKAAELDENFAFALFNRAFTHSLTSNHWESIDDFGRAIDINPDFAEASFNRGLTYFFLKEKDKACSDLSSAAEAGMQKAFDVIERYCK